MTRKKLPIGIQTLSKIREDDCYYVDKTAFAFRLVTEGTHYFLSRPRRFGKSLFLDTLAELFAANEPLFRGLYVHDKWDWSRPHPVIRISFGAGVVGDRATLDRRIAAMLQLNAEGLGLAPLSSSDAPLAFAELIRHAAAHHGARVVVLVDEYDKPILDNLSRPEVARELRDGLRDFYSTIKDSDSQIRFAMLTGVSKFSKVSLFSGLNNLNDITLDRRVAAICGYTDADLDEVFAAELPGLDREEIRRWYNGYSWLGEPVYNPFDVLLLFEKREFRPYWFETGTPTFLVDLLARRGFFSPDLVRLRSSFELLSAFEVEAIGSEALLFQTGYLTIRDSAEPIPGSVVYTLGYPNVEVETSLNRALLAQLGLPGHAELAHRLRLLEILRSGETETLRQHISALFASIPHDWYRNNPIAQYEGFYASVFYSHFAALGLDIRLEDTSNHGRIDMSVRLAGRVYLFEFKVVELVGDGSALEQLKAKRYADKYRARGEPIHLIGIEFSREARNVVGFAVEDAAAVGEAG